MDLFLLSLFEFIQKELFLLLLPCDLAFCFLEWMKEGYLPAGDLLRCFFLFSEKLLM